MSKRIYIADDDANIRFIIGSFLKNEGYQVEEFESGDALYERFLTVPCDLIILDIMMEGRDGLTICAKLRESHSVLIIIVSALDSELDRITGITLGSDDYMVKPFSPVELVARVKSLFRRVDLDRKVVSADVLVVGDMRINVKSRDCWIDQKKIDLTPTEFALLTYMFQHADQAVSRQQLLKHVWGVEWDADTRATDDILKRLRKKLVDSRVKVGSVWGFGFRLAVEDEHEKSEK